MNLHRGFWGDVRLGGRWGWDSIWAAGTWRVVVAVPFMIAGAAAAYSLLFHLICAAVHVPGSEPSHLWLTVSRGLAALGVVPIISLAHGVLVISALQLVGIRPWGPSGVCRATLSRWPRFLGLGCAIWALYCCFLPLSPLLAGLVSLAFAIVAYPAAAVADERWLRSGLKAVALVGRSPLRFAGGLAVVALVFLPTTLPLLLWFIHGSRGKGVDLPGAVFVGLLGSPLIILCWVFGAVFWAKTSETPMREGVLEPAQLPVRTIFGEMIGVGLAPRLLARLFDSSLFFFMLVFYLAQAVSLIELAARLPSGQLVDAVLRDHSRWYDLGVLSLWAAYEICFTAAAGATVGKHLLRLRIVAADGSRLTPWRCVLRWVGLALIPVGLYWMGVWLAELAHHWFIGVPMLQDFVREPPPLGTLLVSVYFLWPAWQRGKRGLQDFIARSVVIRLGPEKAGEVESPPGSIGQTSGCASAGSPVQSGQA